MPLRLGEQAKHMRSLNFCACLQAASEALAYLRHPFLYLPLHCARPASKDAYPFREDGDTVGYIEFANLWWREST